MTLANGSFTQEDHAHCRILVCDDSPVEAKFLTKLLGVLGYDAIKFFNIFKCPSHDERIKDAVSVVTKNTYTCDRIRHRSNFRECLAVQTLCHSPDWKDI